MTSFPSRLYLSASSTMIIFCLTLCAPEVIYRPIYVPRYVHLNTCKPEPCPSGTFECSHQPTLSNVAPSTPLPQAQRAKCISPEQVCDQVKDCPYRDDESEQLCACSCEPGYFRCKGLKAKCIPPSWQCDNVQDCPHGDDEDVSKCPPQLVHSCFPSYSGMYDGGNRKSIPLPWKCDGELDCPKGDDEKFCPIPYPRANCSEGQYNCIQSSTCIDAVSVCDRIADCRQLDDEKDCGGGNSLASLSAILEKYNFSSTAVN